VQTYSFPRCRRSIGVKVSVAVSPKQGSMFGARGLPGNPYDGHTLAE